MTRRAEEKEGDRGRRRADEQKCEKRGKMDNSNM